MRLARPTVTRVVMLMATATACALAPAGAALAHNGTGGNSSDYRIQITGYDGDPSGIVLRIVELGNRLELHRTTASSVLVLGYEGEPYLRLDSNGVAENVNSPAHFLNLDRFASTNPPATASATATPHWTQVASGSTIRWHDHRAHWMSTTPRADVLAAPDVERVIFPENHIDLVVDGRPVTALVRVTWLPPPHRYVWLGAASLFGLCVAAIFVLVPGTDRFLAVGAVAGTVAALLGQGASPTRAVLGGVVIVAALVALVIRRPIMSAVAAAGGLALAATRLEVFEHDLLAGWMPAVGQRIAADVAIALCLGVVGSALVGVLGPTEPPTGRSVPASTNEVPA
ncbi:MAG: hypothetical protein JWL72_759 [Ilumatobacteraceae bacterium]|nr:hypothetical protein [Ilumatobacteraceae bacterium]